MKKEFIIEEFSRLNSLKVSEKVRPEGQQSRGF
jgi:hypothetical protein